MSSLPASPSTTSSSSPLLTPTSASPSTSTPLLTPTPSTSSPSYPHSIPLSDSSIYDETTSLPDSGTSPDIDSSPSEEEEEEESDAEREWKESLQQLELLLTMVVVPYVGKYFGRKCAYWSWAKLMEWKYPSVEVVVTNKKMFKTAGAVGAAASL